MEGLKLLDQNDTCLALFSRSHPSLLKLLSPADPSICPISYPGHDDWEHGVILFPLFWVSSPLPVALSDIPSFELQVEGVMAATGYGKVSVSLPPSNGTMWVEVGPWQSEAHISSLLLACRMSALLHTGGTNGRNRTRSAVRLATADHGCAWGPCQGLHLSVGRG